MPFQTTRPWPRLDVVLSYSVNLGPHKYKVDADTSAFVSLDDANDCAKKSFDRQADRWDIPQSNRHRTTQGDGTWWFGGHLDDEDKAGLIVQVDEVLLDRQNFMQLYRDNERMLLEEEERSRRHGGGSGGGRGGGTARGSQRSGGPAPAQPARTR